MLYVTIQGKQAFLTLQASDLQHFESKNYLTLTTFCNCNISEKAI